MEAEASKVTFAEDAETAAETGDSQLLQAHLAQAREKLGALVADLRLIDAELARLGTPKRHHHLLQEACNALDDLHADGAQHLFWDDPASQADAQERIRRARARIEAFQRELDAIGERRGAVLQAIAQQQEHSALLEDDLFEAMEEEERLKLEWIIEREINAVRSREAILPWSHRGEDDRQFRKSLLLALLAAVVFAVLIHVIPLPLISRKAPAKIPQRVVSLMLQMQPKVPPPTPKLRHPKRPPPPKLVREKPTPVPVPRRTVKVHKKPQQLAHAPARQRGLLAYSGELAAIKAAPVVEHLGRNARLRNSTAKATGLPERSMLTTDAPGSSGGIRLASVSRGLGSAGTAERRDIHGGALTRATSSLTSMGLAGHPLSHGPGPGRTDQQIQIVFDRNKAALFRLYNQELRKNPSLQGKIILRLTIQPDGSVSFCALQSTNMNAPALVANVVARVKTFNFGAEAVPAITIVYPIDFLPAT